MSVGLFLSIWLAVFLSSLFISLLVPRSLSLPPTVPHGVCPQQLRAGRGAPAASRLRGSRPRSRPLLQAVGSQQAGEPMRMANQHFFTAIKWRCRSLRHRIPSLPYPPGVWSRVFFVYVAVGIGVFVSILCVLIVLVSVLCMCIHYVSVFFT